MKRLAMAVAIFAAATLIPAPRDARAAAGFNLFVDDCSAGSSVTEIVNACTSNDGVAFTLVGSIVMPAVTKAGFVAAASRLDLLSSEASVPDWWRADVCRGSVFTLVARPWFTPGCPTLWDDVEPAGTNVFVVPDLSPANYLRLWLGVVHYAANAYDLVGDGVTELGVFRFVVLKDKSVGAGACAGCEAGMLLRLAEVQLQGLNDASAADFVCLTEPIVNGAVSYNHGSGVAARNRTWGAIKALYR